MGRHRVPCANPRVVYALLGVGAAIQYVQRYCHTVIAVLILPEIFALDGVWFSIIVAELLSAVLTTVFLIAKRKKYQY